MGLAEKSGSKLEMLKQLLIRQASENKVSYPLSFGQRALWFLYITDPQSYAYNLAFSARIKTHIDIPAIKRAFQKLINRHFSLRTTFSDNDGELVQTVNGYQELSFENTDASGLHEEELYNNVLAEHRRPFSLESGPLMRVHLFTCSPDNHILLITAHHIIMDFSSFVIINEELWQLYKNEIDCDSNISLAPSAQYIDYVNWQKNLIESPDFELQWEYWREQMAGEWCVDTVYDRQKNSAKDKKMRRWGRRNAICFFAVGVSIIPSSLFRPKRHHSRYTDKWAVQAGI